MNPLQYRIKSPTGDLYLLASESGLLGLSWRKHKAPFIQTLNGARTANGKNPFCIIVPCHRVIAANGKLGGFAGGLPIKIKLLKLERALS